MFELRGVSKHYGEQAVLQGLDLALEPRRITVLLGPSGCGKSTLLRALLGLTGVDAGEIRFAGEPLAAQGLRRVRQRVGYVIQGGGLFPHLTARENITLAARMLGWSRQALHGRVGELVALTDFPDDGLERYPGELSGGQVQRVALMRALMLDPEALLMDEPLSGLDPMIRHRLQRDLAGIFERLDKTVVWVTHDLAEAAYFADTVVLLRAGRLVQQGPMADLLDHPAEAFTSEFVAAQRELLQISREGA